ncbi:MAG TPA: phosphatidylglycerophosphatase A, partial [Polyangiaceae bacterium]|nr:phosphatidylglycerophosphatase A [Polyangiaceae bacterium]
GSRRMSEPRGISDRLALLLAQWFGSGLSPKAPGTVGSLATIPLYWLLRDAPLPLYLGAVAVSIALGIWASGRAAALLGDDDPQSVVIDEVAGVLIALGFVRGFWPLELMAWLLFRAFDITKPGPIDRVQYLTPAGVGIMADDVLAGLLAGIVALGLGYLPLF